MLAELLAHDGVVEELALRSTVGFLALHGGSLERETDPIAREAAEAVGASLYTLSQPDDLRWHIPSVRMDPADSPALAGSSTTSRWSCPSTATAGTGCSPPS